MKTGINLLTRTAQSARHLEASNEFAIENSLIYHMIQKNDLADPIVITNYSLSRDSLLSMISTRWACGIEFHRI